MNPVRSVQIFQEHPSISIPIVERYLHAFPQHLEAVTRYMAHGGQFSKPQVITYVATSHDDAGRLYATVEGSQRLPRQVRLLLFGATHSEIDMAGAFYEIVRRTMIRDFPAGIPLPPIRAFRTSISECLPPTMPQRDQLVKRLPSIAINLSHDQFVEWINRQAIGPFLTPLLASFRALRDQAEAVTGRYSRLLREGHFSGRGQIFRTLECIELELSLRMIDLLTQHSVVSSVVWLHDGIWISPVPDIRLVNVIDHHIFKEFGISTGEPLFILKNLRQMQEALVSQLPKQRHSLPRKGHAPLLGSLTHNITITRTASRNTDSAASTFYARMDASRHSR